MDAKTHYNDLLAPVYAWMTGDFRERVQDAIAFFRRHCVLPQSNRLAYDLGAGHGIQTVALANLGFDVIAVDFNKQLIDELKSNSEGFSIQTVEADIIEYLDESKQQAELVICMGDTLTHLSDPEQVKALIQKGSEKLTGNGKLVFSYRDLSTELKGSERFIHVRSDDARSMLCFLEYFPDYVRVHDIVIEKRNGHWKQKVSTYAKLRIPVSDLLDLLEKNRVAILHREVIRGMEYVIGQRN